MEMDKDIGNEEEEEDNNSTTMMIKDEDDNTSELDEIKSEVESDYSDKNKNETELKLDNTGSSPTSGDKPGNTTRPEIQANTSLQLEESSEILTDQDQLSNQEIFNEAQENGEFEKKRRHSSEKIPRSHQTLKMRLKLRVPMVSNAPKMKEEVAKPPGRRKRGRPVLSLPKKDTKKLTKINLGNQTDRWQEVKSLCKGFKSHPQVAKLLLDCFDAVLDGSLQWTSNSSQTDLKSRLSKIIKDNKLATPNTSWSTVASKLNKKVVSKDELQDEFSDFMEDYPMDYVPDNHSSDEDYISEIVTKTAKRLLPKRNKRKQMKPRKTIPISEIKSEAKRVRPLKVTLSRSKTNDMKAEITPPTQRQTSNRNRRKGKRQLAVLEDSVPKPKAPLIPPELASYPKVFKCRRCPPTSKDTYPTFQQLKEHFETHLPPKKKYASPLSSSGSEETEEAAIQRMAKVLIHCPDCKKLFFPGRLVQHLKTAHVKVLCDECGGMFSRIAIWEHKKAHRLKAQGKKPYKCDKCDKEFLWQVSLRQHRELHSKERPFICSACGTSFKTLTKMKRHEIIHLAVKPFTCPHCERSFTQQTNLKTHMRTHTGEKPYKCDYCNKTFTHKVSMKTHMKKQHGVDLWRDGPPHRVQEFDDVKCQMKRRTNPVTQSIQSIVPVQTDQLETVKNNDNVVSTIQRTPVKNTIENTVLKTGVVKDTPRQEQGLLSEEKDHYHDARIGTEEQNRLLEEQRRLEYRLSEDKRMVNNRLDTRSQQIAGSPEEMVEITLSNRQNTQAVDHDNVKHQMQNCISPPETFPLDIRSANSQPSHRVDSKDATIHKDGSTNATGHVEIVQYPNQYLPVATEISHAPPHHNMQSTNHNQSRYSLPSQSGYPIATHPNLHQGSSHHEVQQGNLHHSVLHQHHLHQRSPWIPTQAGIQGYIPAGSEMNPAVLSELMKLGKQ